MYQYAPRKDKRDFKIILTGIVLGTILFTCGSWAEAVAEHGTDYHYDGPQSDVEGRIEAEQESRDTGGFTSYEDKDGTVHTYENGCENC